MRTREELAEEWLSCYQNEHTRRAYEEDVADFFKWIDALDLDWLDVRRVHGNRWLTRLIDKGLGDATIGRKLAGVRSLYEYGLQEGDFDRNPFRWVRHRFDRGLVSSTPGLALEEAQRLMRVAAEAGDRDFILVGLMLLNGLRVHEVVGARVEDLGATEGVRVLRFAGKGSKGGWARIADPLGEAIDRYLAGRTEGPLVCPLRGSGQSLEGVKVRNGVPIRPMTRQGAWRRFKVLAKMAGLNPDFSPHSMRHTAITLALAEGVPLHHVQDFARHSNPQTTQRYNRQRHDLSASPAPMLAEIVLGAGSAEPAGKES